ncbi:MAG: DUF956 family protein [Streptococcaceae bacterium]|jgi:hypothetical protein|nr:DUF956 family protein [Streptococcaceae bacterium]
MANSLNTQVTLTSHAISFLSSIAGNYGQVLVGDQAFEFFNDKNVEDFIQIPWTEVRYVEGQVLFGKIGRQFVFHTSAGRFRFASKDAGQILKVVRQQLGNDKVVKAASFWSTIRKPFRKKKK